MGIDLYLILDFQNCHQLPRFESAHVLRHFWAFYGHMPIAFPCGCLACLETHAPAYASVTHKRPYGRRILAHTGNQAVLVLEGAFHSQPYNLVQFSATKLDGCWRYASSQYVKHNGVLCGKFMNKLCKNEPFMHNNSERIPTVYEQVRQQKQHNQNKQQIRRMKNTNQANKNAQKSDFQCAIMLFLL